MSDEDVRKFGDAFDRWIADVKMEAMQLFRGGCPAEKCGDIAIAIVEAKAVAAMRRMQTRGGSGIVGVRGHLS